MAALAGRLRSQGRNVLEAREPGGTPVGDAVRAIFLDNQTQISPEAEALLMNASRAQLVRQVIEPALARGEDVICDRYVHSTLAYQGFGRGIPLETLTRMCDVATGGRMPDLTLLIDLPYQESRRRLRARGNPDDRMEREDAAFHERVRAGYLELAKSDARIVTLSGLEDAQSVLAAALRALGVRTR